MNWYLQVVKQYANFKGRARRREYWMFFLFNLIFGTIAIIIDNVTGLADPDLGYSIIYILYLIALFLPGLAVFIRRLHDIGKSGWMILVAIIPIVGFIWLLILMLTDSNPGDNKYGMNPKGETI